MSRGWWMYVTAGAALALVLSVSATSEEACASESSGFADELQRARQSIEEAEKTLGFRIYTSSIDLLKKRSSSEDLRAEVERYFLDTYDAFSNLYSLIPEDHLMDRGDPLRHPVGWYLIHTAAFYVNKFRVSRLINEPENPEFESLFAIGVDEMSWDDKLEDREWPEAKAMWAYRNLIRGRVLNVIQEMELDISKQLEWTDPLWLVLMGIEHERIHLETSSVLLRQLPLSSFSDRAVSHSFWLNNVCQAGDFLNEPVIINSQRQMNERIESVIDKYSKQWISIEGATVSYGRKIEGTRYYGWDNEFGEMTMEVPSLNVSKYLTTNAEWLEFVLDDGYSKIEHWSEEGQQWLKDQPTFNILNNGKKGSSSSSSSITTVLPKFWVLQKDGVSIKLRNMLNEVDLPLDWPAVTNNLEAQAFCNWKGNKLGKSLRLLTEDEWYLMRTSLARDNGNDDDFVVESNINLRYFTSESPVGMFEFGQSGVMDLVGNVWQHTLTPQHPFKGFIVHPAYDDFTVPCFGPSHSLIKGGSWISTGNEATQHSRYQFRNHFYQHAGVRCVESERDLSYLKLLGDESPYTNVGVVDMYIMFHYDDTVRFGVPNFAKNGVDQALRMIEEDEQFGGFKQMKKALDLGCATGRSSFELVRSFDEVYGVDFTTQLIGAGFRLKENGFLEWSVPTQGSLKRHYRIEAEKDLNLTLSDLNRVQFIQNDAQNLLPELTGFDLIYASNLIDRLPKPKLFLQYIDQRMNQHGYLVLLSPYTWLEEYTNPQDWVGGGNEGMTTEQALHSILEDRFDYVGEMDVPFVIRETDRKHQMTLSHMTIWRKQ